MTRKAAPPQAEDNSRRAELVRTAARLFRDQGYERTTVRDLGNAVGLQSGSLFYHFRNKEEILVAVMALGITSTTEQLAAALEVAKTPYDKVSALIHVHLNSLLGENQAALEVMLYEWRSVSATDTDVLDQYPNAPEIIRYSVTTDATEAQTEADRVLAQCGVRRDIYKCTVSASLTRGIGLGMRVSLTYPRFSMGSGVLFWVLGITPNYADETTELLLWK